MSNIAYGTQSVKTLPKSRLLSVAVSLISLGLAAGQAKAQDS